MVMLIGLAAPVPEKTSQWVVGAGHQGRAQDIQNFIGHALLSNSNEHDFIARLNSPTSNMSPSQSIFESLSNLAAQALAERVISLTGSRSNLNEFSEPKGDRGLFGPDSITWKIHADFTVMMVGGLASLMVQALHPRALAAVWDHSDFRNKLKERLGRTAFFVAATTYGSTAMALRAIERVNGIHANIRGFDLDGHAYTANEPALLRWVHIAEVCSFLGAYQHLSKQRLSARECDQYIEEMNQIGHLLGATDLPLTWQAAQSELQAYEPELRFDERARDIVRVVENYPTELLDKPFMHLTLSAAFDVMPLWVLNLLEKPAACPLQTQATKLALTLASEPIQWMLDKTGVRSVALARTHPLKKS